MTPTYTAKGKFSVINNKRYNKTYKTPMIRLRELDNNITEQLKGTEVIVFFRTYSPLKHNRTKTKP